MKAYTKHTVLALRVLGYVVTGKAHSLAKVLSSINLTIRHMCCFLVL